MCWEEPVGVGGLSEPVRSKKGFHAHGNGGDPHTNRVEHRSSHCAMYGGDVRVATTEETPPINQCPYAIPGWSIINERQIYLGSPSVKILNREVDSNSQMLL